MQNCAFFIEKHSKDIGEDDLKIEGIIWLDEIMEKFLRLSELE
jgi:hypothetical protein